MDPPPLPRIAYLSKLAVGREAGARTSRPHVVGERVDCWSVKSVSGCVQPGGVHFCLGLVPTGSGCPARPAGGEMVLLLPPHGRLAGVRL